MATKAQARLREEWIEEAYQHGVARNIPNEDEGDIAFNVIDLNRWGSISMGELADLQDDITAAFERGLST